MHLKMPDMNGIGYPLLFRDVPIVKLLERRRGPGAGVDPVRNGNKWDTAGHAARNFSMVHRHTVYVPGSMERYFGHV